MKNPYESPKPVAANALPGDSRPPKWLRWTAAVLVVSGLIYVPSIVWFVTYPGLLIWIGWATIAYGKNTCDERWFWIVSLLWNAGMAVFTLGETWDRFWINIPGLHSLLATLLSMTRFAMLSRHPRIRNNGK